MRLALSEPISRLIRTQRGCWCLPRRCATAVNQAVAFPHLVLTMDGLVARWWRGVHPPPNSRPPPPISARGLDGGAEIEIKLYLDASQSNVVERKVDHAIFERWQRRR